MVSGKYGQGELYKNFLQRSEWHRLLTVSSILGVVMPLVKCINEKYRKKYPIRSLV